MITTRFTKFASASPAVAVWQLMSKISALVGPLACR
jgi:hypothetical protein